jgi:bla regulator protein BlaR1
MDRILFQIGQVLGATIIHSLWQGLIIYFALRILLAVPLKSSVKYILSFAGLTTIAVWFIYTLFNEVTIYNHDVVQPGNPSALPLMLILPAGIHHLNAEATRYYYSVAQYLPWLSAIYALGFVYNSVALITARQQIIRLKKNAQVHSALQHQAAEFQKLLRISKTIAVKISELVDVPCVAGAVKPVILLPVTLTTSLSAEETEAILLHELAHIRRHDYLANLVQQSVRVLLFFNPFAHLTMAVINRERENSCDDTVVTISKKPLVYAQALMKLEESRRHQWQLTLSATGKRYHLLNRIERIIKPKKTTTSISHIIFTMAMFAVGIITIAWLNPTIAKGKISVRNLKPAIEKAIAVLPNISDAILHNDTTKKKASRSAKAQLIDADNNNMDSPNNYQLFGFGDKKLDELNAEYKKHAKFVDEYYHSKTYDTLFANTQGFSNPQPRFYENDTLRHIMAAEDSVVDFIKRHSQDTPDRLRTRLGLDVGNFYISHQFKTINDKFQKRYHINPRLKYNPKDANYEKYQEALNNALPPDIKNDLNNLKELSTRRHEILNSAEWNENFRRLKLLLDSLKRYSSKSHVKQHDYYADQTTDIPPTERGKYSEKLSAYLNSAKLKEEEALRNEYSKKISDYMSSPKFGKHEQAWKNELRTLLGAAEYDKIIHPEHNISANTGVK